MSKQEVFTITVDDVERRLLIKSLTVLKEKQIKEDKQYSFLDDLIVKICDAPLKTKRLFHEER